MTTHKTNTPLADWWTARANAAARIALATSLLASLGCDSKQKTPDTPPAEGTTSAGACAQAPDPWGAAHAWATSATPTPTTAEVTMVLEGWTSRQIVRAWQQDGRWIALVGASPEPEAGAQVIALGIEQRGERWEVVSATLGQADALWPAL